MWRVLDEPISRMSGATPYAKPSRLSRIGRGDIGPVFGDLGIFGDRSLGPARGVGKGFGRPGPIPGTSPGRRGGSAAGAGAEPGVGRPHRPRPPPPRAPTAGFTRRP